MLYTVIRHPEPPIPVFKPKTIVDAIHLSLNWPSKEQAVAELGQAQLKLEMDTWFHFLRDLLQ